MVWHAPKAHCDDCYFYVVNTKGINRKNRNSLVCPNLQFAIRPIPHCSKIPVPMIKGLPELELPDPEEDQAYILSKDSTKDTISDVGFPPSSLP